MAGNPSLMFLAFFLSLTVTSATPIKFFEDEDSETPHDMFKALRNVISSFGAHRIHRANETKPVDLNIESASSFALGPEQMRKLIAKKMDGAEDTGSEKKPIEKENVLKEEDKDVEEEKEKEMKAAEQIGCSDKEDCNKTSYCNKLSYICEPCHSNDGARCTSENQCCEGYTCDEDTNKCQKKKGITEELDEFEKTQSSSKKDKVVDHCTSKEECGEDFCCALNDNGDGVCQPYLKEGAECGSDPFTTFFTSQALFARDSGSGLPNKCPCHHHLKCEKRSSFLFMDSQVCSKKEDKKETKKPDHKAIIKITLRSSPVMRFHSDDSDDLTSLLPKELMKMLHKPPRTHGFTMRISSQRDMDKKPSKVTSRRLPFPFFPFPFSNPFEEQEIDDIKEDLKTKRQLKRERQRLADDMEIRRERRKLADDADMKRERTKLVDEVGEEARASVHRAVDGIFDTIMKKISMTKKYRN